MTFPHKKRWQRMNWLPRDGETWAQFYARTTQAIEAGTAKTEGLGAQHESTVHAPRPNQEPTNG